jgi:formylglycine-generating enzyme required for sulfatase activity
VWIPSGAFRMGSNKHYLGEAPVHHVSVGGFWIDRTPITNRQFRKFVYEKGSVTFAGKKSEANDNPGALAGVAFVGLAIGPAKENRHD